jgi:hypothetical protein
MELLTHQRQSWNELWQSGHQPSLIIIPCKPEWMAEWQRIKYSEHSRMSKAVQQLCSYHEWKTLDNSTICCQDSHIGSYHGCHNLILEIVMEKFKVGDVVKLAFLNEDDDGHSLVGDSGTVLSISDGVVDIQLNHGCVMVVQMTQLNVGESDFMSALIEFATEQPS